MVHLLYFLIWFNFWHFLCHLYLRPPRRILVRKNKLSRYLGDTFKIPLQMWITTSKIEYLSLKLVSHSGFWIPNRIFHQFRFVICVTRVVWLINVRDYVSASIIKVCPSVNFSSISLSSIILLIHQKMRNQIKLKCIFSYLWLTLTKVKISERIEERWRTNESFNILWFLRPCGIRIHLSF